MGESSTLESKKLSLGVILNNSTSARDLMGDHNFSRAFEHVEHEGGEDDSPIQELVLAAVEFVLSREDFPSNSPDREQLLFVYHCFKQGDDLCLRIPVERKNNERAEKALELVADVDPDDFLRRCNEALRFAVPDTEVLLRAHRQRGAHLQACGLFAEATLDFAEAVSLPSADSLELLRLHHRLAQCHSKCKRYSEAIESLAAASAHMKKVGNLMTETAKAGFKKSIDDSMAKLAKKKKGCKTEHKQPRRDVLPGISSLVRACESALQGRFSVASEDIPCGTIVAVDDPVASLLNPDARGALSAYCCRCLAECPATSLPCRTCSAVVYCSAKCRQEDLGVHAFECRVNLYQHRLQDTADSCRIFLTVRAFLHSSVVAMREGYERRGANATLFKMLSHRVDREDDEEQRTKYLVLACVVYRVLRDCEYLEEEIRPVDSLEVIHALLQIQDVNTHPVMALDDHDHRSQVGLSRIGNAVNVRIGSFFNHSCNPNTCRINQGRRTLLVATRNIRKGQEVSDIYSMHYSEIPREQRREWLGKNFFFVCQCQACSEDWKDYGRLPSSPPGALLMELQAVEKAIHAALMSRDFPAALALHIKDVGLIEGKVTEPHRLFVSVRNSLQFCLWRRYSKQD